MGLRYRRRYRRYSYSAGHEAAKRHIREAHELSEELGGTDKDVKSYFFSLDGSELSQVLAEYERATNRLAREYAEKTLPVWRSGRVQMSGTVAARLFRLLPARMPLERKYSLVESLWEKYSPQSQYTIMFGPNADIPTVRHVTASHLAQVVSAYTVPEQLQRRFEWLSDGDSMCYQQLLNHFLARDARFATDAVALEVGVLLRHLSSGANGLQSYRKEVAVGGHRVDVVLDPSAEAVTVRAGLHRPSTRTSSLTESQGVAIAAAIGGLALLLWWLLAH